MDIKELFLKKMEDKKKEELIEELENLYKTPGNKKYVKNNLKELFGITLIKKLIAFIENIDLSKYNLVVEFDSSGHVGIGTTNPL